jgi:Tol biopolymer transport system component
MPSDGGVPRQVTFHTSGSKLEGWLPDGQGLLVNATRDHYWSRHSERFFKIRARERSAEELLFDDYGQNGSLSPDGKRIVYSQSDNDFNSDIWLMPADGSKPPVIC